MKLSSFALYKLPLSLMRKLAWFASLAISGCFFVLICQPVTAQPIRNAEVIELAPKTANTQPTKIALVIGNAQYTDAGKLGNPVNDATDLAEKLKAVGFTDPILAINQTTAQFKQTLKTFRSRLRPNAEVVVYYAGHGMSVDGTNYLLPVDVKLESKADLRDEAISLKNIIEDLNSAQIKTSILILDSCRNNPFSRGWKGPGREIIARGWSSEAVASAAAGIKIFYATKDGEVANDGAGRNGHFTSSLLRHIETPGMSLNDMIDQVTADLHNDPKVKQTPWSEGSMIGTYYFKPPPFSAKNASLREKGLAGDQKAFEEWLKNDPDANRAIAKFILSKQSNISSTDPLLPIEMKVDKKTAALVIAQSDSDDLAQRKLGAAMASYLMGQSFRRTKALGDMLMQGNEFAAFMLHRLEVVKIDKSPVQIPQAMLVKAEVEIERLSRFGDLVALSWHSNIYRDGLLNKPKDENKAFLLIKQAAESNYPYAQYVLGIFYEKGTMKDGERAKNWYLKAIENGDINSLINLGTMYRDGTIITKNEVEALRLYKKAADANNQYGQQQLGYAFQTGTLGLKSDGEQAKYWYMKAIENGSTYALVNLAGMYHIGKLISQDESAALKLYIKAAEKEDKEAQGWLGYAYREGRFGLNLDAEKAKSWYLKSIDNGNTHSMLALGWMYENGNGVQKDEIKAVEFYRRAAEANNSGAIYALALLYWSGQAGLPVDKTEANRLFRKAADLGHEVAIKFLAK